MAAMRHNSTGAATSGKVSGSEQIFNLTTASISASVVVALLHADETADTPFLSAGPVYAKADLYVLPLGADRKPLVKWGRAATNDPDSPMFRNPRYANAGIGIACKPSGLLVVDLDVKHPEPDGTTGVDRWNRLSMERDPQNAPYYDGTTLVRTPSGGLHLWFRDDHGTPGRDAFLPGVDVKAAQGTYGGFVVAPPTLGANGRRYEALGLKEPRPVPAWLRDKLVEPDDKPQRAAGNTTPPAARMVSAQTREAMAAALRERGRS